MTIFNSYVKLAEGSKEIIKHNLINHPYVDGPFHTFIVRLWTNNVLLPIIALLVFMALISIYLHGSLCAVVHMCDFIPSKIESNCCRKKCLVPDPRRPFIHPTCASPWDDWYGGGYQNRPKWPLPYSQLIVKTYPLVNIQKTMGNHYF